MANYKISQLTPGAPALATDVLPIARSGQNYSLTAAQIAALAYANPMATPAWLGNWEGTPYSLAPVTDGYFTTTSANLVQAFLFKLPYTFSFNTLLVGFHVGAPAAVVGIGIYDTDGNRLAHWDSVNAAFSNTIITADPTGGPLTLPPDAYYWAYACGSTSSIRSGQGLNNGGSAEASEPWNHNEVRGGHASNLMSGGILPDTLGDLTAGFQNSNQLLPCWIVEP